MYSSVEICSSEELVEQQIKVRDAKILKFYYLKMEVEIVMENWR